MDRAFDLAERARGRVSPNPFVGCVIVGPGDEVVGEGWTQPPGEPHAEIIAVQQAGPAARGATAYVTLEPCDHTGLTPPCSTALVDAGVARVVIALSDPNPIAAGGVERLREAGIGVDVDVAPARAARQNEVFLHAIATGRPFVIAKTASSLDGFIADHAGTSQWLTGPKTRLRGHQLRAEVDAVLVGSATALADDPSLTVRLDGYDGPQPLRVVLDRRGRLRDADLRLLRDGEAETVVMAESDPGSVLDALWGRGVRSVLVEGGAGVIGAFVVAGLVDRFELHLAGTILGQGLPSVAAAFTLAEAPRLEMASAELCDDDVVVTAYPRRGAPRDPDRAGG